MIIVVKFTNIRVDGRCLCYKVFEHIKVHKTEELFETDSVFIK